MTEFATLRSRNRGVNAKKIDMRYFFLAPDVSESFPHKTEKMIVAVALVAANSPTSATLAPKTRARKVERMPDEPNAMFKGTIAIYHGVFCFSTD